jgi:hypothetical protein
LKKASWSPFRRAHEGIAMLKEGVHPRSIEQAGLQAGRGHLERHHVRGRMRSPAGRGLKAKATDSPGCCSEPPDARSTMPCIEPR